MKNEKKNLRFKNQLTQKKTLNILNGRSHKP
jgi:hypothetical protein